MAEQALRRRATFASREEAFRHYASKQPLDALDSEVLRAYVDHGFEDTDEGGVRLKCRPRDEASVYEMATAHDAYPRLHEVTCPVTVAWGSESHGWTPDRAGSLAGRLPSGRSEVLAELGHFGPLERPQQVASSIRRFLAHPRGGPE